MLRHLRLICGRFDNLMISALRWKIVNSGFQSDLCVGIFPLELFLGHMSQV